MNIKDKVVGGFFSSTMWFGFVIMAATWLENNTELLQSLVDGQYASLVGYAIGIAIWGLRWITTKPVEEKRPGYSKPHTEPNKLDEELSKNNLDMF